MSHDDDALIILSVVITPELAACLDRKVAAGPFGASREEVAQLYLCNAFGVAVPAKQVSELPVGDANAPPNPPDQTAEQIAAETAEKDAQAAAARANDDD